MKKIMSFIILLSFALYTQAQYSATIDQDKKMEWWREAKFGMFIHWGPYSILGGVYKGHNQNRGGAEWIMNRCKIPVAEYQQITKSFNPTKYDAESWVRLAKEAGMKYIVITTKHHDGFAMFKSNASKYNIVDFTTYNKDVLDELAKACRKYNMKLGFYYSHAQDWNNPGGSVARKLMREGWPNPDSTRVDAYTEANNGYWDPAQQTATMEEYINKVSIPQIKELLTNYGDVAVFWWDTPTRMTDDFAEKISKELAKYPQIIQNDRLKRPNFPGDYKTPEGRVPKSEDIEGVDWETCMNIGSSWGFKSWENAWKPTDVLIRNLITIAARGGNYLLNVGPTPEGEIPEPSVTRLKEMGAWMKINGEAIYGTQRSLIYPAWGECIRKDNKTNTILYLCVFEWPSDGKLHFNVDYDVKNAILLQTKANLKLQKVTNGIVIDVPVKSPDAIASVIKLELKEKLPLLKIVSNSEKTFEILDL